MPEDFGYFDLILGVDRDNVAHMKMIVPSRNRSKIELFLNYGDQYHEMDVPDPYGGQERHYEDVLNRIEDGCQGLVKLLVR